MIAVIGHLVAILGLTAVSQVGGVAWVLALAARRRLLAFGVIYGALSLAMVWVAPLGGRVVIGCGGDGPLQVRSWVYCALNRTYVTPQLLSVLQDLADGVEAAYPGTQTVVLDGSFPLWTGFPLLPHLSHDDGEKADLAFYYRDADGYRPGATKSPLGYFAFEPGPETCPPAWPSLRWSLPWLQPLWRDLTLEPDRLAEALRQLTRDPRVGKVFLEPHLQDQLGLAHPKLRFQGCRAARHDDHIHLQL